MLLDSIIVETCNIKENRNIVLNYKYDDENWLINYTKFIQIRYYIQEKTSTNCLIKTINECKRNKIKIVKSLDDIKFDETKKASFEMMKAKFEPEEEIPREYEQDYFDFF